MSFLHISWRTSGQRSKGKHTLQAGLGGLLRGHRCQHPPHHPPIVHHPLLSSEFSSGLFIECYRAVQSAPTGHSIGCSCYFIYFFKQNSTLKTYLSIYLKTLFSICLSFSTSPGPLSQDTPLEDGESCLFCGHPGEMSCKCLQNSQKNEGQDWRRTGWGLNPDMVMDISVAGHWAELNRLCGYHSSGGHVLWMVVNAGFPLKL